MAADEESERGSMGGLSLFRATLLYYLLPLRFPPSSLPICFRSSSWHSGLLTYYSRLDDLFSFVGCFGWFVKYGSRDSQAASMSQNPDSSLVVFSPSMGTKEIDRTPISRSFSHSLRKQGFFSSCFSLDLTCY
jgi:hypothetical protein